MSTGSLMVILLFRASPLEKPVSYYKIEAGKIENIHQCRDGEMSHSETHNV